MGDIVVDGEGTTLIHRQEGPTPQYNGIGSSQEFGRFDQVTLGVQRTVRTITLTNGGEYRIINAGNNSEGGYKNINIGFGGGKINIAAGYLVQNLDDNGQIGITTDTFTKTGKGRLTITGAGALALQNPLAGNVNIDQGMLDLSAAAGGRFLGIAAAGGIVNVNNGGTLFINSATQNRLDIVNLVLNDGSILAMNGADHIIGTEVGGTTLTVNGTAKLLSRDLFNPQQERLPRIRTAIMGSGVLELVPNANSGGNPRVVIERGSESTFSGTFRLLENQAIEANPRNNPAVDIGKVLADGDVDFAGWASRLDVRDSNPVTSLLGYTTNDLLVTSTQAGSVPRIVVGRATTATGTGSMFNFGTLTMGNQRLGVEGNNGYQVGVTGTATITGNSVIEMRSDLTPLVFANPVAIAENAAGRSLTLLKTGAQNAGARDVIDGGAISLSNLTIGFGPLFLRGDSGAITTGFGGSAPNITIKGGGVTGATRDMPTAGQLNLDNNTGHVVGFDTVFSAGNNSNRVVDSAVVNMQGNSILRLTSQQDNQSTEVIGTVNVAGHSFFDIVKNGTAPAPVALTLSTVNLGANATANFSGTNLGVAGTNTSRIVIPGTAAGPMSVQFHSGNEWAKYDTTSDNGFDIGVTPFVASDYIINSAETTWAAGQTLKQNGAAGATLTASRDADRLSLQFSAANQAVDLAGFVLTLDQGGLLVSNNTAGIIDGVTGTAPSGTAGITSSTGKLYVVNNSQFDIRTPVVGNIDFIKSGTGTVRLIHQSLAVGTGNQGGTLPPFTTPTWTSTLTGSWIVDDGTLQVQRGQFLGGRPVVLNGGTLEINEPVSIANANTIIPGWGNNFIVNGNAMLGMDDNGESADAGVGGNSLVKLGSLTINNNATLGTGSFNALDIAFMNGGAFNGRSTINIGPNRNATTGNFIVSGPLSGDGFDLVSYVGAPGVMVLGGTQTDTTNNAFTSQTVLYAATLRMNKANGFNAISDTPDAEDVVINGGALVWGPGHHGDLSTTNNFNSTNNGISDGIVPTSPAAIKAAGMNQIADTASITLLTGSLGQTDRIQNEKFGTLIQKNGTFNIGLGAIEVTNATISGGAFNIDRSGSFKAGTLTLLPGAPDLNITTGIPTAGSETVLEIGAGGTSLNGQNINLGTGSSGNVAGSGAVLKLGGNVTVAGNDLVGGSYGRKGIYIQIGSSFRELGNSRVDLLGGTRNFDVDVESLFTITAPLTNGGISKSGGGALILEPYRAGTFTGPVIVSNGVVEAKGDGAFGTSAGGVTVGNGASVKLDSGWTYGDAFTVTGPGALIPGGISAREVGALIATSGYNHLTGAVVLAGDATLAGDTFLDPSVTPGAGGMAFRIGTLSIEGAGGITGAGTVTLSGNGDGVILNGVKTSSGGLNKDGSGIWTISGAGTYTGLTTISAGTLLISNGTALGTTGSGTRVYGGSLALTGGISVAEPLTISGNGSSIRSGAIVNAGGNNTLTGAITLLGTTIRSDAGLLTIAAPITGGATSLTLDGAGNGSITGAITLGAPASGNVLTKNGTGTWTLSSNALNGSTAVNGGTLILASGSALHSGSALNMGGGNLTVAGGAQTVAGLNLDAGGGTINGGAGLSVGAISQTAGASVNFAGTVTTSTANTNGILGGYATVGSNWARVSGGVISALPAGSYTALASAGATSNAISSNFQIAAGALTVNSLKIAGGSGLDLGFNGLALGSGGLLSSSPIAGGLGGSGFVSGAFDSSELTVHVTGAPLDISAPLIGAFGTGGLTKAGAGKLVLSGTSTFTGPINVNAGTLSIVGPGGTTASAALGDAFNRTMNINGGTFEVVGNDYDPGAGTMQFVVGLGGGTIRTTLGAQITVNDANQLSGAGDLTYTGGGRYRMQAGTPRFTGFTGGLTVDGGILLVGDSETIGGRQEQTITLKPGSAIMNGTGFGLGQNGLPNNMVFQGETEIYASGGSRVFGGDLQFNGTNTIALMDRDALASERQIFFNGRVAGTGVTLNVFGVVNNTPLYLASGANAFTGAINLNENAVLETRVPGSLGVNNGDVTVNLNGANSRLLLRHFQNADYKANVTVGATSEINSDRLAGFAGGANQYMTINNLTVSTPANNILTISGGNNYTTRVAGTATFNSDTPINASASAGILFENGITFAGGASILDKRGGASVVLQGVANNSGSTIVQGGFLILQGANGALPNTSAIQLRGGELRLDDSNAANGNRLNDAAPISLGGGALRITGAETLGTVTADSGTTQIINNPTSETVASALTLTGFTRKTGSVVQFQAPDLGTNAVGATSFAQARVSSRILIPGQANTTLTIPGFLGNNNLDFIQYDGTTIDGGQPLGVQEMRNPGNVNSPQNYANDPAETAWNAAVIARLTGTTTTTLTADRALDAIKIEGGANRTIDLTTRTLRISGAGILAVGNTSVINGTGAIGLTAGAGVR